MRIRGADPDQLSDREKEIFRSQATKWGEPLANHLVYARVPSIFHGAQGMWRGLDAERRLEHPLIALLNRRVALLNGCEF
jgi:hypothetical protein